MTKIRDPIQLAQALELKYPGYLDYDMEVHSGESVSTLVLDSSEKLNAGRWNYSAAGMWTLIPCYTLPANAEL